MPLYQEYLYVVGSFQGVLLAMLLIFSSQVSYASRILGIWCLFLALRFLAHFIAMDGELNAFTWLIGWDFFIPASYGALLYLYCKYALISAPFKWKDLLHFLPFVFCYLINYDIMLMSAEVKLQMNLKRAPPNFGVQIAQVILFAQAYIYIALSVRLIWRCRKTASQTLSNYNPEIFNWLWKLLILDSIIWTLKLTGLFFGHIYPLFFVGDILIFVLLYTIALAQWRNPRLFTIDHLKSDHLKSGQLRSDELESSPLQAGEFESDCSGSERVKDDHVTPIKNQQKDDIEEKVNKTALEHSVGQQLLKHIQQQMDVHQLYLESELTLNRLADACGVSSHHLSEVLNQHDGKNFYRFVNEYRVAYICQQLKADATDKVLDVGLRSGFSSKSTFNAVFKQIQGVTPSQYKNAL
jgi:AraC-like DNA-binding protein